MCSRSRLSALLVIGVLLLATASPAFAAQPECDPKFGVNCGDSIEHRANPSGQGNFGQCHKAGATTVGGQDSSLSNPSPQNVGEADCRTVSGRGGTTSSVVAERIFCEPPSEPVAESQINYQPELNTETRTTCQ
jgi:hypothetical protein